MTSHAAKPAATAVANRLQSWPRQDSENASPDRVSERRRQMSLGALWDRLNDPARFATPQSTVDAVVHCVRERGVGALKEPANIERLLRCDAAAKKQIDERIEKLLERRRSR